MKKLLLVPLILIMSLVIMTSTAFAAQRIIWRSGAGSFTTFVTSPVFHVGRVDGRQQKDGINELDMRYSCASRKVFKVTLYTQSGRVVSGTPNFTCTPHGGVYNSFSAWLPVKSAGNYRLRFSSVSGSGRLTITSYQYYYFKP